MSGIVLNSPQDKNIRDEKKPEHIVKMETAFYDIIGTRNRWNIQELQDNIKSPNVIYWNSNPESKLPITVIDKIDISICPNKNVYPAIIGHLEYDGNPKLICNFREVGNIMPDGLNNAISIKANAKTIGYYLPSLNSFVFGNLAWHEHYTTVLMRELWPRMIEKLSIH